MTKPISGTREWSTASVNCITGCEHACRYCYAREQAMRFGRISPPEEWATPVLRVQEVHKRRKKVDGRVMFPTTHDLTSEFKAPCFVVLKNLLEAGDDVLIVTKPHLEVVVDYCEWLKPWRDKVLWRFTIGSKDDDILSYWEPGAPNIVERLASLLHAYESGYATSVSCEPCLDIKTLVSLFCACEPFITDTFWIGKANKLATRCVPGTDPDEIARVEAGQTDEAVRRVYAALKDEPKIRWKESYCKVLGISQTVESEAEMNGAIT